MSSVIKMFTNSIFGLVTENHWSETSFFFNNKLQSDHIYISIPGKSYEAELNDFLSC